MPLDIEALGAELATVVAAQLIPLQKEIADLRAELAAVKREKAIVPELPDVQGLIDKGIAEAVAAIPVPKDGKDCDMDAVNLKLVELVKAIPAPKDGADGKDGEKGLDGKDGDKGMDGTGLAGAMLDRDGCLIVTLTNGEVKNLGVVVGKDGENGKDGLSFENFTGEYLPETNEISIKATCAGRTQEIRYPAGGIRPAGYWRDGTQAKAGEAWVHDGSTFYAKKDTLAKPEAKSDDWIMGARKGRDFDPNTPAPKGTIKLV